MFVMSFPGLNILIFHYYQINTSVSVTFHSCCIYFFPLWLSLTVGTTADSLLAGCSPPCCNLSIEQYWLERTLADEETVGGMEKKKRSFRGTSGCPGGERVETSDVFVWALETGSSEACAPSNLHLVQTVAPCCTRSLTCVSKASLPRAHSCLSFITVMSSSSSVPHAFDR